MEINKQESVYRLNDLLNRLSEPFIEEFRDASSYMISQFGGTIKQFTIDLLEDWEEVVDMDNFNFETPGDVSYQYSTLLDIVTHGTDDYKCIETFVDIAGRWVSKMSEATKNHWRVERAEAALNQAAQEKSYKDWNEVIYNFESSESNHPERHTFDDIVIRACMLYAGDDNDAKTESNDNL